MTDIDRAVLFDVDGVLANFTRAVLDAVAPDTSDDEVVEWDIFAMLDARGVGETARAVAADADFWRGLPLFPDATTIVAAVRRVRPVVFATSPWPFCAGWAEARRAWLREHFGASGDEVVITSAKDRIRGATLFDDKPDNVRRWGAANPGKDAFLIARPYNEFDADGTIRVSTSAIPYIVGTLL